MTFAAGGAGRSVAGVKGVVEVDRRQRREDVGLKRRNEELESGQRDRQEQRPERFAVNDRVDAMITAVDKAARKVSVSIKALEMADDKEAIEKFGSSDSGASLGDILGAALAEKEKKK